ncbi:MAG: hypothetical protein V3V67_13380 [Myxococcota bacterium]
MPSAEIQPEVRDRLAGAAQEIAARLLQDPQRRAESLGEIFLACERTAREHPDECLEALEGGSLESFLLPCVRASLRRERNATPRGGWLGTFIGVDGRPIEADADGADPESTLDTDALELAGRALKRALSQATAEGNETLLRNLRWYQERLAHKSYDAIARAEGRVPATVRTGVARARKFVLRAVHELQNGQPAPLSGEAPAELEPLRKLWVEQDLESLAHELERTRAANETSPHWLNLAALLAGERGQPDEGARLFEQALVFADAPSVRGRVLNNLGNLVDDLARPEAAVGYWLRASQLVPHAPAPLLNLLAAASSRKDYAAAQHCLTQLADLLSSGRLRADERAYVCRRLAEHPKLAWLRETDAWRGGPARWIRASRSPARAVSLAVAAAATAALALFTLLTPAPATAGTLPQVYARIEVSETSAVMGDTMGFRRGRGGDSMGKPPRKLRPDGVGLPSIFLAGDTMGRSGSGRGGTRPARGG